MASNTHSPVKNISVARIAATLIGVAVMAAAAIALIPAPPLRGAGSKPPAPALAPVPKQAARPVAAVPSVPPGTTIVLSRLERPDSFEHGNWLWNEDAAPATGPVIVAVDLQLQMMSVFRGGHEIGVAVIGHGASDKPTPLGIFPITEKDADHRSSIYDGAPMPWMLRLTSDGVAVHGSNVRWEWGTNGCVGIPNAFAQRLFGQVKLGDRVVITSGRPMLRIGDRVPAA
jgi:lipoprotein-anchoring transpeptidase ErfK/SrfK